MLLRLLEVNGVFQISADWIMRGDGETLVLHSLDGRRLNLNLGLCKRVPWNYSQTWVRCFHGLGPFLSTDLCKKVHVV